MYMLYKCHINIENSWVFMLYICMFKILLVKQCYGCWTITCNINTNMYTYNLQCTCTFIYCTCTSRKMTHSMSQGSRLKANRVTYKNGFGWSLTSVSGAMVTHTSCMWLCQPALSITAASMTHTLWPSEWARAIFSSASRQISGHTMELSFSSLVYDGWCTMRGGMT